MKTSEEIKKIGTGSCAEVYKIGDMSYKIYKKRPSIEEIILKYKIRPELIKILKDIKHVNFLDIQGYEEVNDEINMYYYKYIPKCEVKLCNTETEYLLVNLKYMDKLADILTSENIAIRDNHSENIIFDGTALKIIDPDYYELNPTDIKNLKIYNKRKMLGYIRNTLENEMGRMYFDLDKRIERNFEFEITENTELASELSKRLTYKYPRQMF